LRDYEVIEHLSPNSCNEGGHWANPNTTDIENDGDLDVIGSGMISSGIYELIWWENNDGLGIVWTEYDIDNDFYCKDPYAVDMDGDGDADVMAAAEPNTNLTWWENNDSTGTDWISSHHPNGKT